MPRKLEETRLSFSPSSLATIDGALYKFIDDMDLFTDTNSGWKKVPIIWAGSERAFLSKLGEDIRDKQGALKLPLISIERNSTVKDPEKKGAVWANIPPVPDGKGGSMPVARYINQVKTKNFANADAKRHQGQINFPRDNEKVVFQTYSMPIPVYVTCTYEVTIRTNYQQQMNEIMTPFMTKPGGINYITIVSDGNHRYEGFIRQDFSMNNNSSEYTNEERRFETKINIEILGYLIGDDKNQEKPFFAIRENVVEVKMPRERLMLGEIPEHEKGSYYGLAGVPLLSPDHKYPLVPIISNVPAAGAGSGGAGLSSSQFKNIFIENYAIREVPAGTIGGGNDTFTTLYAIRPMTETVFFNGMLIYPTGASPDYELSGLNEIKFSADYTPQTAEEKGGGNAIDDIILITYVRDS